MLASETPALDIVGATFVRELDPGEIVVIDEAGCEVHPSRPTRSILPPVRVRVLRPAGQPPLRQSVHQARIRMGEQLAEQAPAEADMVMGVPESGVPAAEGFASATAASRRLGLVKNRYIGRSITPARRPGPGGPHELNPLRENITASAWWW